MVFLQKRSFKETHTFLHFLIVIVGFGMFMVSFALFQVASTVEFSIMNYHLESDVIFLYEQPLLKFPAYHELINTFVMKKEIQKKVYIDEWITS